jgi:hypothetical protein
MIRRLIGGLAGLLLATGPAQAAPIQFFGLDPNPNPALAAPFSPRTNADGARASFLGGLSSFTTVDLESAGGGLTSVPFTFGGITGAVDAGASGGTGTTNVPGTDGFGGYPISGSILWQAEGAFQISLSSPITAVGFYGIDVGDATGSLKVSLFNGATTGPVFNVLSGANTNDGSVLYLGIVDAAQFDTILFENSLSGPTGDRFNFDDFTVGFAAAQEPSLAPTPEPGTLLLLGTSLAGMAGAAWKRRKAAHSSV